MEILSCFSVILPSTRKRCNFKGTKRQNACEIPLSLLDISHCFIGTPSNVNNVNVMAFPRGSSLPHKISLFPYSLVNIPQEWKCSCEFWWPSWKCRLPDFSMPRSHQSTLICCKRIGLPTYDWEFPSFSEIVLKSWEKIPFLPQLPLGWLGSDLGIIWVLSVLP